MPANVKNLHRDTGRKVVKAFKEAINWEKRGDKHATERKGRDGKGTKEGKPEEKRKEIIRRGDLWWHIPQG